MIQGKDFLYRVPVKTAPITTPRGQIRNPEILVDLEGGEFMHGNILDANSTNKLINQSVKDAVDDKFIESGYVKNDLFEAETSARTKGDEDLSAKIKAEQTRAEGKEKEISDKLAIVDGDSNTEGSFRKAIADVIAAAPEDLDTLKEIADKLADNDDLHTALNQAITDKADASALANEVTRATGAESNLRAAIATKADATALSNYVLATALNQQVDTLNAAISAKQDAGNYIPFEKRGLNDDRCYIIAPFYYIQCRSDKDDNGKYNYSSMSSESISVHNSAGNRTSIDYSGIVIDSGGDASNDCHLSLSPSNISSRSNGHSHMTNLFLIDSSGIVIGDINNPNVKISSEGIKFANKSNKEIPTADGTFIVVDDFASIDDVSSLRAGLSKKQNKITVNEVDITDIETADITKLRTIVTNLINALVASGLIIKMDTLE